jgi:erythrocyte band 7 integral membrane protein
MHMPLWLSHAHVSVPVTCTCNCGCSSQILSKDSVTVAVDAVVYYSIHNCTMAITNVEDVHRSTRLLAQTTLRNILGMKNLSEILSDREHISATMRVGTPVLKLTLQIHKTLSLKFTSTFQEHLDEATDPWGVKVERVEM